MEAVTGDDFEFELKGGLVVAEAAALAVLHDLADQQRERGVTAIEVPAVGLPDHEPHLAPDLAGGVLYPQDAQVQPMLATARLLQPLGGGVPSSGRGSLSPGSCAPAIG